MIYDLSKGLVMWVYKEKLESWVCSLIASRQGKGNDTPIHCPWCKKEISEGAWYFCCAGHKQRINIGYGNTKRDEIGVNYNTHDCGTTLTIVDDSVKNDAFKRYLDYVGV
jgi:hypothetical protein